MPESDGGPVRLDGSRSILLDGDWNLAFTHPDTGEVHRMSATAPGNVEIDLQREGLIDDPWPPDDIRAMWEFERVDDWTYETQFDAPQVAEGESVRLVFEGVDTIADVTLNGEQVLRCENMFVPHSVDVTSRLRAEGNSLSVCIRSPERFARRHDYSAFQVQRHHRQGAAYLRKARHMWGWDNAPRLLSAGLWRPVYLRVHPEVRFSEVYAYTRQITDESATIGVNWAIETPDVDLSGYEGRLTLSLDGVAVHEAEFPVEFTAGKISLSLPRSEVRLWWPSGYGEPVLYDLSLALLKCGEAVAEWSDRFGIREVDLVRTEVITAEREGEFVFVCNGEKIYVRGTNWKPKDALHSRAARRTRKALELCSDLNCNMVRIWGGGVYEDHGFFDYCDENGILVWQDFMFACEFPPKDDSFCDAVAREAETVVKRLRNHPSLAVWCGDNEVDATFFWSTLIPKKLLPSDNRITREVLRDAVKSHDPYRDYVPSSPYKADCLAAERRLPAEERSGMTSPEEHLYPGSEEFRTAYRRSNARFIGETGPFFINSMSQTPEIVERELPRARRLWDQPVGPGGYTLDRHQTDEHFLTWKDATRSRLRHFFDREFSLDRWEELALALNIVCADMFKFAVEHSRCRRWRKTGVLWWSLMDMWPMMFNYSVVDYRWHRKQPSYDWIRAAQEPVCLMVQDVEGDGVRQLYVANDTLHPFEGEFDVHAVDPSGQEDQVMSDGFSVEANCTAALREMMTPEEPALLILQWQAGDRTGFNHYVWGEPPFSFATYTEWCRRLERLYRPGG